MNFHITIVSLSVSLIITCCGLFQCVLAESGMYEIDGRIYVLKDGANFSNLVLRNVRTIMPDGYMYVGRADDGGTNFLPRGETENPSSVVFTEFRFWRDLTTFRNIKFDNSDLRGAIFGGVHFEECSFRGANLRNMKSLTEVEGNALGEIYISVETYNWITEFRNCDFTDAIIDGAYLTGITGENFRSTKTYKDSCQTKQLVFEDKLTFRDCNLDGTNFEGYNLKNISFWDTSLKNCNLSGAYLENIFWSMPKPQESEVSFMHELKIMREHLLSSKNYQLGIFIGIRCSADFSDVDLSSMQFVNCGLGGDFANVNFEDAVLIHTSFFGATNLTINQIKSTWNYKHNRMEGIKLPEEIQKALDAEKEKQ